MPIRELQMPSEIREFYSLIRTRARQHPENTSLAAAVVSLEDAIKHYDAAVDFEIKEVRTPKPGTILVERHRFGDRGFERVEVLRVTKLHVIVRWNNDGEKKFQRTWGRAVGEGSSYGGVSLNRDELAALNAANPVGEKGKK